MVDESGVAVDEPRGKRIVEGDLGELARGQRGHGREREQNRFTIGEAGFGPGSYDAVDHTAAVYAVDATRRARTYSTTTGTSERTMIATMTTWKLRLTAGICPNQ